MVSNTYPFGVVVNSNAALVSRGARCGAEETTTTNWNATQLVAAEAGGAKTVPQSVKRCRSISSTHKLQPIRCVFVSERNWIEINSDERKLYTRIQAGRSSTGRRTFFDLFDCTKHTISVRKSQSSSRERRRNAKDPNKNHFEADLLLRFGGLGGAAIYLFKFLSAHVFYFGAPAHTYNHSCTHTLAHTSQHNHSYTHTFAHTYHNIRTHIPACGWQPQGCSELGVWRRRCWRARGRCRCTWCGGCCVLRIWRQNVSLWNERIHSLLETPHDLRIRKAKPKRKPWPRPGQVLVRHLWSALRCVRALSVSGEPAIRECVKCIFCEWVLEMYLREWVG